MQKDCGCGVKHFEDGGWAKGKRARGRRVSTAVKVDHRATPWTGHVGQQVGRCGRDSCTADMLLDRKHLSILSPRGVGVYMRYKVIYSTHQEPDQSSR